MVVRTPAKKPIPSIRSVVCMPKGMEKAKTVQAQNSVKLSKTKSHRDRKTENR